MLLHSELLRVCVAHPAFRILSETLLDRVLVGCVLLPRWMDCDSRPHTVTKSIHLHRDAR